jgi:V8-like Glu-specific endopeptidase
MRSRLALIVAPLLLLSLLPGAVSAAGPSQARAAAHERVLAYWTPARLRAATPRDYTFDAVRGFKPAAKPGGGGGGTTTGSSWIGGGDMLRGSGKVWFTLGGDDYICSGSVVKETTSGQSIVLTAGHCVVESDGEFATNFVYIPAFDTRPSYDCESSTATVYGCWVADALYADKAFATAGGFNDTALRHDWAFAVVSTGGHSGTAQLDATVGGGYPIQYNRNFAGTTLSAFGYPAAGKYKGKDLVYCRGPVSTDPYTDGTTWSMPCGMTGGSSGGPWVEASVTSGSGAYGYGTTTLSALNSYGYTGIRNMYGPKFNDRTKAVFDAANSGNLTSTVVRTLLP